MQGGFLLGWEAGRDTEDLVEKREEKTLNSASQTPTDPQHQEVDRPLGHPPGGEAVRRHTGGVVWDSKGVLSQGSSLFFIDGSLSKYK